MLSVTRNVCSDGPAMMVLKLWKPVCVLVKFGWSCRADNVVGNVSDSVRFIVSTLRSFCVCSRTTRTTRAS